MNYLLMPLEKHYDCGLGMTACNFYDAAKVLEKNKAELWDSVLPICFLKRHSIELFLKSLIYILHKKYRILFGRSFSLTNPGILRKNGKSISMFSTHDIVLLYERFSIIYSKVQHLLPSTTNWDFPDSIKTRIDLLGGTDPKSTYFRYPNSTTRDSDSRKSKIQKTTIEGVLKRAEKGTKPTKTMFLLDSSDEIIECYDLDSEGFTEIQLALSELCEFFQGAHAAFRFELCKGS